MDSKDFQIDEDILNIKRTFTIKEYLGAFNIFSLISDTGEFVIIFRGTYFVSMPTFVRQLKIVPTGNSLLNKLPDIISMQAAIYENCQVFEMEDDNVTYYIVAESMFYLIRDKSELNESINYMDKRIRSFRGSVE